LQLSDVRWLELEDAIRRRDYKRAEEILLDEAEHVADTTGDRLLRTRVLGERTRPGTASLHLDAQGRLIVHCADGGVLQVLEHDVDGKPDDAADLRQRLGGGSHRLGAAP